MGELLSGCQTRIVEAVALEEESLANSQVWGVYWTSPYQILNTKFGLPTPFHQTAERRV
ncbi:hypothetical protein P7K49_034948 [Saguinus oedipus]|uniref:Uncharacterized protein n=1 Tax=Saguinus oedipus TaxID=9490 RepID=A0ABQ9TW57_SAGOE|nr:hypothetical protein P7K49_034948 [Saguinus oedipus]